MSIKQRLNKINYVEFFIVVSIAFLTIFLIKFFGVKKEYRYIRVEVIKKNWSENFDPYGYRVPFWLSDKIKIGQTEKDKTGKIIATIVDFENYIRGGEESEIYLTVKIETILNKRTGVYIFKEKPLNIGTAIELNLDNINLQGQIIDNNVPQGGYPTKNFVLKLRGQDIAPWIYSKVKPGLKMYNRANNETIAEIINVSLEKPTLNKVEMDSTGKFWNISTNSENRDLLIEAKIKGYLIDNRWYFAGHQSIHVPSNIYLYTDEIFLYELEVEEIKELLQ